MQKVLKEVLGKNKDRQLKNLINGEVWIMF